MKTAKTVKGEAIIASANAPKEAICPYCGGTLTLRGRRSMKNSKVSYFWRHYNNHNPDCSGRNRPV